MKINYLVMMGNERSLPPAMRSTKLNSGWLGLEHIETPFIDRSQDIVIPNESIEFKLAVDGPGGAGGTVDEAESWGHDFLGLDQLLGLGIDGRNVRIGILDSGIQSDHDALEAAFSNGRIRAFAEFDADSGKLLVEHLSGVPVASTFGHWHGTFVSSLITANSPTGITNGVAPGADLFIAKVLDTNNNGSVASIHEGLCWLKDRNCDIVNLSLGWEGKNPHWFPAIDKLLTQGSVVFCASGNEFADKTEPPTRSPANYPIHKDPLRLISVGAIGLTDETPVVWASSGRELVDWSTYKGKKVPNPFIGAAPFPVPDLVAPGDDITSAGLNDTYRIEPGTSFATPYVAGIVALILSALRSKNASAPPDEAVSILFECLEGPSTLDTGRGWPSGALLFDRLQKILSGPVGHSM